jgi:hypothetical protein
MVDKVQKKISNTNLSKHTVNSGYLKGKQRLLHQWHLSWCSGLKWRLMISREWVVICDTDIP